MPKEKKERKHAFWFEPERQMDSLMEMQENIQKMMREFWKKPLESGMMRTIPIDLSETEKDLVAKADLPGFSKEEIRLKVTGNTIEISAEKKKQVVQKGKNVFRQERSYGAVKRVMALPYAVKPDETKAKFENGVLTVVMPKAEQKRKAKEISPE